MGFGKGLGLGLLVYVGFNILLTFLAHLIWGMQIGDTSSGLLAMVEPATSPGYPFALVSGFLNIGFGDFLFFPLASFIGGVISAFMYFAGGMAIGLIYLLLIVTNLIVAFVVGKYAGSKGKAYGAMFLIVIIGSTCSLVASTFLAPIWWTANLLQLSYAIALDGVFYGLIARAFG